MEDFNNLSHQSLNITQYNISKMTKDMNFVGLATIIYGAINCLMIIGAIIGIPLIFMGLRIREAANLFDIYNHSGDQAALNNAFEKQHRYFYIQKIFIIISLIFMVLYIVTMVSIFSFMGYSADNEIYSMLLS